MWEIVNCGRVIAMKNSMPLVPSSGITSDLTLRLFSNLYGRTVVSRLGSHAFFCVQKGLQSMSAMDDRLITVDSVDGYNGEDSFLLPFLGS